MKLRLLAVGKAPSWIEEGFAHYARRLPPENALELVVVPPGRGLSDEQRLLKAVRPRETMTLFDEQGTVLTSRELAAILAQWRQAGRDVALLIGGTAGFSPQTRAKADCVLSLSALTFPHQLARVLVAEQLYRAWAILHGHPYHRQ